MVAIAVDYDGTFSAMPEVWREVIELFRRAGARVFCISSRFPNFPIADFPGEVFYSCGAPKWEFAHSIGLHVDIWVDDFPSCIGDHPERRGAEPPQTALRRDIVKQLFRNMSFEENGNIVFGAPRDGGGS